MSRTSLILCLLMSFLSGVTYGQQTLHGKVIDAESQDPIPYVNIGIINKGVGTVSNLNGNFSLSITNPTETLTFSSIGYSTSAYVISEVAPQKVIELKPKVEMLEEVVIRPGTKSESVTLGKKLEKKGHSVGFGSRKLGTEIAAKINVSKETLLESAHFTVNFTEGDSLLFRLNIYDAKTFVNYLNKNIIINAPLKKGTFSVDLSSHQVVISDDIYLSLEWIQDDNNEGNNGIMFRARKGINSNLFIKNTSQDSFKKLVDLAPGAPSLNIGFYCTGIILQ